MVVSFCVLCSSAPLISYVLLNIIMMLLDSCCANHDGAVRLDFLHLIMFRHLLPWCVNWCTHYWVRYISVTTLLFMPWWTVIYIFSHLFSRGGGVHCINPFLSFFLFFFTGLYCFIFLCAWALSLLLNKMNEWMNEWAFVAFLVTWNKYDDDDVLSCPISFERVFRGLYLYSGYFECICCIHFSCYVSLLFWFSCQFLPNLLVSRGGCFHKDHVE